MPMAISLATFRAQFPEFENLADAHVQAHLDAAETVTATDVGDAVYEQLVYYYAADSLASSPWGYNARLSQPGQPTAYKMQLDSLMRRSAKRGLVVYGRGTVK